MASGIPVHLPWPYHHGRTHRTGGWLTEDAKSVVRFVRKISSASKEAKLPLHPLIQDFKALVESTPSLRMYASAMLTEVPDKPPYINDPTGTKGVRDFTHLLHIFNYTMQKVAPQWNVDEYNIGLIGFPFNAVLDWPMATPSGYAFFLNEDVNVHMKRILEDWRIHFLSTSASAAVLTEEKDGWLSAEARRVIEEDTNLDPENWYTFEQFFGHGPADGEHWGFKSWDDFFTRQFANYDLFRPVHAPDDDTWVVSACESKPFALQSNVKDYDTFWLKGQPYSVMEMLNGEPEASDFVDGTIYQAFLSATSYHRWHSPVNGTVTKVRVVDGTMFSEPTITGFMNPEGPDPAAPDRAQGYITHVATRALIFIQAPEPIGLMCVVEVGMADVSTCEVTVKENQTVTKGQEIGMFHHGGSTHCLLFRKGVNLTWVTNAFPGVSDKNIPLRGALAQVTGV
ncbi:phosphatidylserine decarboxylase family protein [Aspergillus avenaceus]|uniref:Phosphatidylserine decarboxylase family protein n=1 Tax=Aspergillus avenaceus TaxID=36643 RepID=A0A5N6U666_ASPAV|nr:phosphatidylserine decarboxylase family protein [Aspergillus avenaceus]